MSGKKAIASVLRLEDVDAFLAEGSLKDPRKRALRSRAKVDDDFASAERKNDPALKGRKAPLPDRRR